MSKEVRTARKANSVRHMSTARYTLEQVDQYWNDGGLGTSVPVNAQSSQNNYDLNLRAFCARLPKSVKTEKSMKGTSLRVTTLSRRHLPWRGLCFCSSDHDVIGEEAARNHGRELPDLGLICLVDNCGALDSFYEPFVHKSASA